MENAGLRKSKSGARFRHSTHFNKHRGGRGAATVHGDEIRTTRRLRVSLSSPRYCRCTHVARGMTNGGNCYYSTWQGGTTAAGRGGGQGWSSIRERDEVA